MKTIIQSLVISTLFFLQINVLSAQDGCPIYDPLFDFEPEIDLCCDLDTNVCYYVGYLDILFGDISQDGPFVLASFYFPGGVWSDSILFNSYQELTDTLNWICQQNSVDATFEWNPGTKNICAYDVASGFGLLGICCWNQSCNRNLCYPIIPSIEVEDCPLVVPDIEDDILDPENANISNDTLFDGSGGIMTTDSLFSNSPAQDTFLPSVNTSKILVNALIESGFLEYGGGCFNLNCIDLSSLGEGLNTGSMADTINAYNDPPSGTSYSTMSEALSQEIAPVLDTLNLTALLNSYLGLQLPDEPCGDTLITLPLNEMQGGPENGLRDKDNLAEVNPPNGDPNTTEDVDFFSQQIAGLGLDGPGAAMPSPSAMEMIKNVKAGVDLYNGSQSSTIPLYNYQANDISLPISISSLNNGLKVNDLGTLVGQNWNLNVGGMISRVVKGLPDEFDGITKGVGVGRKFKIDPRFEIPTNIGLTLEFPGSEDIGCISGSSGLPEKIKNGFVIASKQFQEAPEGFDEPGSITLRWSPFQASVLEISINIPIATLFGTIKVFLEISIQIGVTINEKMGTINYEEEGTGFLNFPVANAHLGFHNDETKLELLKQSNSHKYLEDKKFLNDLVANWNNWKDALNELKGNNFTYKTDKLDTEPDEFYFNVGGYSGKFSYNVDTSYIIFPHYEGLTISHEFDATGRHLAKFTITTPDGMEYTFGNTDLTAVDITRDTNYYLPNFYTYPKEDSLFFVDHLGKAEVDRGMLVYYPPFHSPLFLVGRNLVETYGNTYNRNYKIMQAPEFTSAWHLVKVKSLLTLEEVELSYENRNINYYSDKSYSHSFPNFDVDGNDLLKTSFNTELNPFTELLKTKWKNGRAEFAYSVTQTNLQRWHLTSIQNINLARGETIHFDYNFPRGEIAGDFVCDKIEVRRSNQLFKGWKLNYKIPAITTSTADCDVSDLLNTNPVSIEGETVFDLGDLYSFHPLEYNSYFFMKFRVGCFTFPLRLALPYKIFNPKEHFGYRNELREFGSLMEVKELHDWYDESLEVDIYNAEKKRTFLCGIEEIDKDSLLHPLVDSINYIGDLTSLPKRYSFEQDLFGYFNFNQSGSPLPPIKYYSITGASISSSNEATKNHFGFFNKQYGPTNMRFGHNESPDPNRAKVGAIESIVLASGGKFSFEYELNEIPTPQGLVPGAGLRVVQLTEDPFDTPPRITKYEFDSATVVNHPIRIYQDAKDIYYPSYERKVVTTSRPQNQLFSNKNNHVGYGLAKEKWDGIGHSIHYFTTPKNFEDTLSITDDPLINETSYWEKRLGLKCPFEPPTGTFDPDICSHFTEIAGVNLPPSLRMTQDDPDDETSALNFAWQSWLLGIEYKNEIFNQDGSIRQRTENEFESYYPSGGESHLTYFNTHMYQYNYPGSFWDNYWYRLIQNYQPFQKEGLVNQLVQTFVDLILGTGLPHPFKYIERNYYVSNRQLRTGNVRLLNTQTTDYLLSGPNPWIQTSYLYNSSLNPDNPTSIFTTTSDGHSTTSENLFVYDDTEVEVLLSSQTARDYLESKNYLMPLLAKSYLNGQLIQSNFTALTKDPLTQKIVPLSNWTRREGVLSLVGNFSDYNPDGKPAKYELAKHSGNLFPLITLEWNGRLQLTKREYGDFSINYGYDTDYFVLTSVIDPDSVLSEYSYDPRWRLQSSKALNGRQETTYTYNIGAGANSVTSDLEFTDGSFPNQTTKQFLDGFGRGMKVTRENDGALLSATRYDNFFRVIWTDNITSGEANIEHEASPLSRETKVIDAVGNETISKQKGSALFFGLNCATDPNGHTTEAHTDGLGRTRLTLTGEGDSTKYYFDSFGRLDSITNPIGEGYSYDYNEIDQVINKKIPGAGVQTIWWDEAFRPAAYNDANGNLQVLKYDQYNRITKIINPPSSALDTLGNPDSVIEESVINSITGTELLINEYENQHTWLKKTKERIFVGTASGSLKETWNLNFDDIGRPAKVIQFYPDGSYTSNLAYSDAMLVTSDSITVAGPETVNLNYSYGYDDLVRPKETILEAEGISKILSRLQYNAQDLLSIKYLGESDAGGFLQQVDYGYDAAGKLIYINTPGTMECFQGDSVCTASSTFCFILTPSKGAEQSQDCPIVDNINIDGQFYTISPQISLTQLSAAVELQNHLEAALDYFGLTGEVTVNAWFVSPTEICFDVQITNTNAESITLLGERCFVGELDLTDCCVKNAPPPVNAPNGNYSLNDDLFFEKIRYDGLDIDRIDMSSNCLLGNMRNEYTYDANHRVTKQHNIFFTPTREDGRYNTSYKYDPAGNIDTLERNGFISSGQGGDVYGPIDLLAYEYENERLKTVTDLISDQTAQPHGFVPTVSGYFYDGNGNIISDNGKALGITYNFVNLPAVVNGVTSMSFHYTFGAEKTKKVGEEERIYLGGMEYKDGEAEAFYNSEGRVLLEDLNAPKFQYKIADHLGDLMVFFEDKDGNGDILTESETSNTDSLEVFQRHLYYPFGLNFEGVWDYDFEPNNNYQYNGKELEKDLGLNWSFYGFRMYDVAIGRFTGVDPIGDQFAHVSTYNYAENSPIANIDLYGLQKYFAADGEFVKQVGEDNKIRILPPYGDSKLRVNYNNLSNESLKSMSVPAQITTKENEESALRAWANSYQDLSNRYSNDWKGDREFAMTLFSQELTNEDGSTFEAFVEGTTAEGDKGVDGISLTKSESPFEGWNIWRAIHTHRWGDDSGNFSDDEGLGSQYFTGDIQTALRLRVPIYLVVPYSNYIGSFDPNIYNERIKSNPHKSAKRAATDKYAIKIE